MTRAFVYFSDLPSIDREGFCSPMKWVLGRPFRPLPLPRFIDENGLCSFWFPHRLRHPGARSEAFHFIASPLNVGVLPCLAQAYLPSIRGRSHFQQQVSSLLSYASGLVYIISYDLAGKYIDSIKKRDFRVIIAVIPWKG